MLPDLVDFSPQVAKDAGPHERDDDARGMIELPGQPERGDALLEAACRVAEDPGSPARDLPAAHAGVVAAIDERVAPVPRLVVERHPLIQVAPRGVRASRATRAPARARGGPRAEVPGRRDARRAPGALVQARAQCPRSLGAMPPAISPTAPGTAGPARRPRQRAAGLAHSSARPPAWRSLAWPGAPARGPAAATAPRGLAQRPGRAVPRSSSACVK